MAKSQQTFNKKEREIKRKKKRQEKLERQRMRKELKAQSGKKTFEEQLSYLDENGNLTDAPPDPAKKFEVKAEDINLSVPHQKHGPMTGASKGKVKFFNDEKGYGFIIDATTKESLFVHIKDLEQEVKQDDKVTYEIQKGPKGFIAVNVKLSKGG